MLAETYLQLLTNVPHWAFELTVEAISALVGAVFARIWVKRHDRKHHPKHPDHTAIYVEIEQLRMRLWMLERKTGN